MSNPVTTAQLFALAFLLVGVLALLLSVGVTLAGVVLEPPLEYDPPALSDAIAVALCGLLAVAVAGVLTCVS